MQNNQSVNYPRIDSNRSRSSVNGLEQDKFGDVYKNINTANTLIKTRLERLKHESELLKGIGKNFVPYNRDVANSHNMRNMMKNKNGLMNPNLYANQYIDPIYYPLEMPINAEPVTLPKIELGQPLVDPQEPKIGKLNY